MRFALLLFWVGAMAAPVCAAELRGGFPLRLAGPEFDWSGLYLGAHGGYSSGSVRVTAVTSLMTSELLLRGPMLGVSAGANWQLDRFVFGLEGELGGSGIGAEGLNEPGWLGALKGRAGLAMDRSMLFVAGGLAGGSGAFDGLSWGWTMGVGAEVVVTETMSVKAEYGLYSLGPQTAEMGSPGAREAVVLRSQIHVGRLGVNWHF